MESFDLISTNNRFQKPPRNLWTCQYPNGSRGQVDYIIVRRKLARSVSNVEIYSSTFDSLDSDHKALSAQIKLNNSIDNSYEVKTLIRTYSKTSLKFQVSRGLYARQGKV